MVERTKLGGFVAGARALQGYDLSAGLSWALEGKKALLVAGEKDGKLPEGLKALADQLKEDGRDVDFFQVPNAGHLPVFLDNGLQEFLERVEGFLEE
jgi:pimeloyl-ACP methyl ester carboxylesterase